MVSVKRVYEAAEPWDGARFLVDRLWPRGVTKESLALTGWIKEAAPSDSLRQWFGHDPGKWEEFKRCYFSELDGKSEVLQPLIKKALQGNISLLFSARDTEYNNAVALKEYLEAKLGSR